MNFDQLKIGKNGCLAGLSIEYADCPSARGKSPSMRAEAAITLKSIALAL